jgi:hypothetical protein
MNFPDFVQPICLEIMSEHHIEKQLLAGIIHRAKRMLLHNVGGGHMEALSMPRLYFLEFNHFSVSAEL